MQLDQHFTVGLTRASEVLDCAHFAPKSFPHASTKMLLGPLLKHHPSTLSSELFGDFTTHCAGTTRNAIRTWCLSVLVD